MVTDRYLPGSVSPLSRYLWASPGSPGLGADKTRRRVMALYEHVFIARQDISSHRSKV